MNKDSKMMSYFWRAATTIWLWTYWSAAMLFRATALVLAIPVLAVYLIPDFLPKFGSSRSTSRSPHLRRLAIPLREGGKIWALNPDGSRVELSHLEAVTQARAWNDVCFGALVAKPPSDKGAA